MEKRNIFLYEENKLKEVIEIINKQIKEAEENFSKQEHTIIGFMQQKFIILDRFCLIHTLVCLILKTMKKKMKFI